jgi:predicted ATPase
MLARHAREDGYQPQLVQGKSSQFIVLSGCSGGGKSSLLAELGRRGFATYEEPGRQVVKEQLYVGGDALPWADAGKFIELTISRSIYHLVTAARGERMSFFDRGIIDQLAGFADLNLPVPAHLAAAAKRFRYNDKVFMVPPWPAIFTTDSERRHSFEDAVAAYITLLRTYQRFGYRAVLVPQLDIRGRADFVISSLT